MLVLDAQVPHPPPILTVDIRFLPLGASKIGFVFVRKVHFTLFFFSIYFLGGMSLYRALKGYNYGSHE